RDHDRGVDDRKKRMRVNSLMTGGQTGRFQSLRIALGHEKFDRERLQNATVVRAPAPHPDKKYSFRLLHLLPLISKVRHLRAALAGRNEILTQASKTFLERALRERVRTSSPHHASGQQAPDSGRHRLASIQRAAPQISVSA